MRETMTMSEHDGDEMSSGGPEAARAPRRVEELLTTIDRQREELDLLAADLMRVAGERDGVVAERDRLAAELRAVWGKRDGLPRTSSELRAWRREREMTQKDAARRLGVGHATVERAEEKEPGAALGRVLRRALERDAARMRETLTVATGSRRHVRRRKAKNAHR